MCSRPPAHLLKAQRSVQGVMRPRSHVQIGCALSGTHHENLRKLSRNFPNFFETSISAKAASGRRSNEAIEVASTESDRSSPAQLGTKGKNAQCDMFDSTLLNICLFSAC